MSDDLPDVFTMDNVYLYFEYGKCNLYVDGVVQPSCFAFSLKEQWADVYKKDSKGLVLIEGKPVTERLYGKITAEGWYE